MRKKQLHMGLVLFACVFFVAVEVHLLMEMAEGTRLDARVVSEELYREQNVGESMIEFLRQAEEPGKCVALYLLETNFGYEKTEIRYHPTEFSAAEKKWKRNEEWMEYLKVTESIWDDVKYFPVPNFSTNFDFQATYVNTWMSERSYGGKRGHEGTDLMASKNVRGLCPVVSMTDGVVTKKGWLEKGGYRIGIESPGGAYFYYAHLDSYASVEVGDTVQAGDVLGYMGDSGYGPEGTTGKSRGDRTG